MTEKDLKKLNRYQLLELLIIQTKRVEKLQKLLEDSEKQLKEQNIKISSLGNIAEASMQVHGVFQAAQDAADTYLNKAKRHAEEIEQDAIRKAADIIEKARRYKGE